ncbi:MAG: hypothetical protein EWV91_08165 [Microcystis aeruginosa Ma_QC_Ca_00000000_S207]|uniref:Uncharacterized protein n=1 Tax=Microcystis aeruginosa Ma_QC_Ca_00000000_S207 TaxID=2486251 RepID=A0A552FR11_MICAE|nr:MAG: hypothetical protein EWV91_08165 [Microcystis aeruginosa Ma_QC_Ca_00000000_S207]
MRSSPKENQSLEVKVKGISEMEFSLSIFDYTFTNYCCQLKLKMPLSDRILGVDDVPENRLLTEVNSTITLFENTCRQFLSMVN